MKSSPLVRTLKYIKWNLRNDIRQRVKEIFEEISSNHDSETDTCEIAEDHMYIFLFFSLRHSISKVGGMLKSISVSVIFHEHPETKKELWGGEFWEDGYFVRTGGYKVTVQVMRNDINYHREQEKSPKQLELFLNAPLWAEGFT